MNENQVVGHGNLQKVSSSAIYLAPLQQAVEAELVETGVRETFVLVAAQADRAARRRRRGSGTVLIAVGRRAGGIGHYARRCRGLDTVRGHRNV